MIALTGAVIGLGTLDVIYGVAERYFGGDTHGRLCAGVRRRRQARPDARRRLADVTGAFSPPHAASIFRTSRSATSPSTTR